MFAHEFMRNAFLAGTFVALACGLVGYFVVLRAQVFAGDALSHVAFTGALAAAAAGVDVRLGLFVATIGGHLAQLDELSTRVPVDGAPVWVTNGNEQSTSLLAGQDVHFVPYVGVRSVGGVLRCVPAARRLMNSRKLTGFSFVIAKESGKI